jgi:uncharacterized protein YcbK (DUF882 family)
MMLARRELLSFGATAAVAAALPSVDALLLNLQTTPKPLPAPAIRRFAALKPAQIAAPVKKIATDVRRAFLHNVHTGDVLDAVYYENGAYVPGAMNAAMKVLRDWRDGEEHFMDPRLFDLLHGLSQKVEARGPVQILCGYRSPSTNAMLREHSKEVASRSQHLLGKALDIHLEGVELEHLHRAAISLRAGGVGYYPTSGFVHVDVGPLRQWVGT